LRRRGILKQCSIGFFTHAPAIFGVPYFARALVEVAARYGINVNYQQQLVAVNGNAKTATFEFVGDNRKSEKETVPFDLLHVTPPQSPHEEIKKSPLANAAGWVDVNQNTLQDVRFANVYSLGDVCSTPNSKTAAAVRKQAPVVANEIITAVAGKLVPGAYDGYASCPLTTAIGKVILAEFCYGSKVTPTLPLNPSKERWFGWWIKLTGLPLMYWHYMLKG
jgi:sulfide:quinone oxidoreductase